MIPSKTARPTSGADFELDRRAGIHAAGGENAGLVKPAGRSVSSAEATGRAGKAGTQSVGTAKSVPT